MLLSSQLVMKSKVNSIHCVRPDGWSVWQHWINLQQIMCQLSGLWWELANEKDSDASQEARALLKSITDSKFLVTLFCYVTVMNNLDLLSKILQEKEICLRDAMQHVQDIIAALEDDRRNSESDFQLSWHALKTRLKDSSFILNAIKQLKNGKTTGPDKDRQQLSKRLVTLRQSLCRWCLTHR